MNNEQANTNASTVDVEEEKHSAEGSADVNQEVVSEAETPEAGQAASATEADVEVQGETSSEVLTKRLLTILILSKLMRPILKGR